eukprot:CAMPEP_0179101060 /NCGR_PEP_ID=MMETSP0796-20121207/46706_1 /TAXON_ID=73915 /ORGANISM="Pyrodinium bahamense, Strain pbaha01" /LENGTH=203 /DNA_ID=CAMNT_0020798901 /DNA_START=83 /DNA_END=692 /DNA_ORIENTATION=+
MALASFAFATAEEAAPSAEGLLVDDECLGSDTQCSLNALQLRGVPMLSSSTAEGQNASKSITMLESGQGWYKGGDKVWGNGRGIEVITSKNVGYYDGGMDYARAQCSDPGCALIINPPGHRTVQGSTSTQCTTTATERASKRDSRAKSAEKQAGTEAAFHVADGQRTSMAGPKYSAQRWVVGTSIMQAWWHGQDLAAAAEPSW